MIMKDVVISITGVQQGEGAPSALEMVTQGQYGMERDKILLHYQESELTGMEGAETSITIHPRRVEMLRQGGEGGGAQMIFEEGAKNYFLYNTPFGSATMGLHTNKIHCRMGEHGGFMVIDYSVDMEEHVVGRNRFFIHVKEKEESHSGDIRWPI